MRLAWAVLTAFAAAGLANAGKVSNDINTGPPPAHAAPATWHKSMMSDTRTAATVVSGSTASVWTEPGGFSAAWGSSAAWRNSEAVSVEK